MDMSMRGADADEEDIKKLRKFMQEASQTPNATPNPNATPTPNATQHESSIGTTPAATSEATPLVGMLPPSSATLPAPVFEDEHVKRKNQSSAWDHFVKMKKSIWLEDGETKSKLSSD